MIAKSISIEDLCRRLLNHGHSRMPDCATAGPADIWPSPEEIVTVGLDPDPTLLPMYRRHYFACVQDAEENPLLQRKSIFSLPLRFADMAEPPASGFLAGPFRWLLSRAHRFSGVLLWPNSRLRRNDSLQFLDQSVLDEFPHLQQWLHECVPDRQPIGALLLDLNLTKDCHVLWEVGILVGQSEFDFYISDPSCSEVYLLHHHDKIVISIPDTHTRQRLLDDLSCHHDVLKDCSGYIGPADHDYGWN